MPCELSRKQSDVQKVAGWKAQLQVPDTAALS
jgi:hypothetical protein